MVETVSHLTTADDIPAEWDLQHVEEIFSFFPTASHSRSKTSRKGTIGYIHYGDIHTKFGHYVNLSSAELPRIPEKLATKYSKLQHGDIVIADASEDYEGVGKSIEIINEKESTAIAGLHTLHLRDTNKSYSDGFRAYITEIPAVKRQLITLATGLKVYGISKGNLKKVLLPVPPIPEQGAIAQALTDVDDLIHKLDRLIEKKKLIKKGVMQELLAGKRRLPGFEGEWEEVPLGEINYADTSSISPQDHKDEIFEYYSIPDYLETQTPSVVRGEDIQSHKKLLQPNTILFGRLNPRVEKVWKTSDVGKYRKIGSGEWLTIVCNDAEYDTQYIYYMIWSKHVLPIAKTFTSGSTPSRQRVMANLFYNIRISVPPTVEEQQSISSVIQSIDDETSFLEEEKTKMEELKIGMMQQLLTGRIRLV